MGKSTRNKRIALIPEDLKARLQGLDDQTLLGVHDLCHDMMETRYGSPSREEAEVAVEARTAEVAVEGADRG